MATSKEISAKIATELDRRRRNARAGLFVGGLLIERRSKERVPVEYGNLRASGYTGWDPDNPNGVVVGYTARYAAAVHEKVAMKLKGKQRRSGIGQYWGPKGEAKFLEKPHRESREDVKKIVASYMGKR